MNKSSRLWTLLQKFTITFMVPDTGNE